ncbi:MAG: DivIVA domain-containing protein [Synergistaceae bacterium]|nr:DivIVA domain-containing protein [Synergistaceae bacterium]
MSDLLTAKDVEVKAFKKVRFGGYSVPEVEDFLNQVADDLEAYTLQLDEKDARIQELESFVKKQEGMNDAIKDALILARKAAQDMEDQAKANTEKILADAHAEAEKITAESEAKSAEKIAEAEAKASEILMKAKNSADDILQASQDKRAKAEQSRANIEQELESRRRDAEDRADDILANARAEARRIIGDAQKEVESYNEQIRFLSLQKQDFVKKTASLLFDFGKILDRSQDEINQETGELEDGSSEN